MYEFIRVGSCSRPQQRLRGSVRLFVIKMVAEIEFRLMRYSSIKHAKALRRSRQQLSFMEKIITFVFIRFCILNLPNTVLFSKIYHLDVFN